MNVRKTIEYWTRSAEYDLEVADSLFENKKYHYTLFFGHLAIEKILKGIMEDIPEIWNRFLENALKIIPEKNWEKLRRCTNG